MTTTATQAPVWQAIVDADKRCTAPRSCAQTSKGITEAQFEALKKEFPSCERSTQQASMNEWFCVEWYSDAEPSRLVHFYKARF